MGQNKFEEVKKQLAANYCKNPNRGLYPLGIEQILGVSKRQSERLFKLYKKITGDNQNNSINAKRFFDLYFEGKLNINQTPCR